MPNRYTILGAGRQGIAIASDLVTFGNAESILLTDIRKEHAVSAAQRVNFMMDSNLLRAQEIDGQDPNSLRDAIEEGSTVISALPYSMNVQAAKIAVEQKAHFCDLGGNTGVVKEELRLHHQALEAGVSILPDCGLAPGLSNLLAARALQKLGSGMKTIKARCGGLPQIPRPPYRYKMVFSVGGLINEYSGEGVVLRKGHVESVPTLTEIEEFDLPEVGELEAFVTSGGTSTAPYSFQGKVENYDYKTIRYRGHCNLMKAYQDLGLFSQDTISVKGQEIVPRNVLAQLLEERLHFPNDRDLVILLVDAEHEDGRRYSAQLIDKPEATSKFTAMERTTGFPTAVVAFLQAEGKIEPGARPIEIAVPLDAYFEELQKRDLDLIERVIDK